MSGPPPPAAFRAGNTRALRAAGVAGADVWGTLRDGALELHGVDGGVLRIAPGDVARVRVGHVDGARRVHQVRVWRRDAPGPLVLAPHVATWGAYREVMRGFAASLADAGAPGGVEGGSSRLDALLAPALLGLVTLGAIAVAALALGREPWWGRLLVPAPPLAIGALLLRVGLARHWPRPVRTLAELDRYLPAAPDRAS